MNILDNKQYYFTYDYLFYNETTLKKIDAYLYINHQQINIFSYYKNKPLCKMVYEQITKKIVIIENYFENLININGDVANNITQAINLGLKENLIEQPIDYQLLNEFNYFCPELIIPRNEIKYTFRLQQHINQGFLSQSLYKCVGFYNEYAYEFNIHKNKGYLYLELFKQNNEFIYCITESNGNKLCKFVFSLETDNEKDYDKGIFRLIRRENYALNAQKIDFLMLNKDFKHITVDDEDVFDNIADEKISYYSAVSHNYLPILFKEITPLSLSI